ncbi:unnamed protein product [Prorocentrum cordatum]|uniref:Beta-galactosidase n=1 Tax=Prorocentrum cordatum TaxID=2364126 RepID=A0ABN9Q645_9DINO|nr:unnamed protein product [Polarella glacialis]
MPRTIPKRWSPVALLSCSCTSQPPDQLGPRKPRPPTTPRADHLIQLARLAVDNASRGLPARQLGQQRRRLGRPAERDEGRGAHRNVAVPALLGASHEGRGGVEIKLRQESGEVEWERAGLGPHEGPLLEVPLGLELRRRELRVLEQQNFGAARAVHAVIIASDVQAPGRILGSAVAFAPSCSGPRTSARSQGTGASPSMPWSLAAVRRSNSGGAAHGQPGCHALLEQIAPDPRPSAEAVPEELGRAAAVSSRIWSARRAASKPCRALSSLSPHSRAAISVPRLDIFWEQVTNGRGARAG